MFKGLQRVLAPLTVSGIAIAGCGTGESRSEPPRVEPIPTVHVRRVFTPEELGIEIDTHQRPYDTAASADSISIEPLTSVVIPDGALRVMDGNAIEVDPGFFADEASPVEFDTDLLDTTIVWEEFADTDWRGVLAVVLSVPETTVDAWQPFEYAYGTDGGLGGFTSQSVIDVANTQDEPESESGVFELSDDDLFVNHDYSEDVGTFDLDDTPGTDTLIFANGFGDGGFPMTRGLDDDDRLVSLAILDTRYPWRLAFPDGEPPVDITRREDEIAECLAGQRDVEIQGDWLWCVSDI